jgi:DNA polymerase-1
MNLVIDGNNVVNAAYYAFFKSDEPSKDKLPEVYLLFKKMLTNLSNKFSTNKIYIAWDGPRGSHWRKNLVQEYKATRSEKNSLLLEAISLCKENSYQNFCIPYSEGDDTINALVQLLKGENIIVSSDKDFIQCVQRGDASKLYNFIQKSFREIPTHDIILEKAVVGDSSDNIKGLYGIGPKKFIKLLENNFNGLTEEQLKTIQNNCTIIDLNKNPNLEEIKKRIIDILKS